MFSHIVVFWTDPAQPSDAQQVLDGANALLKDIPGLLHFHAGKMVGSARPVVDQTYSVALNLVFPDKAAELAYQTHPKHLEFIETFTKRFVKKIVIYDFE